MKSIAMIAGMLLVLLLAFLYLHLCNRFSYATPQSITSLGAGGHSVLTIGIIGDSWAASSQLDTLIHNDLAQRGIDNSVISRGHPGAKTKTIYEDLFLPDTMEHSMRYVLEAKPHYCIVIAGVNDAIGQVGPSYYAYHTTEIANTLLAHGIKPVLVTLPEFDVLRAVKELPLLSRVRNVVSAHYNNGGEIDNIFSYRKALQNKLEATGLENRVITVRFDSVCSDYSEAVHLYRNHSHLNRKGNEKLAAVINNTILKYVNTATGSYRKELSLSLNNN